MQVQHPKVFLHRIEGRQLQCEIPSHLHFLKDKEEEEVVQVQIQLLRLLAVELAQVLGQGLELITMPR